MRIEISNHLGEKLSVVNRIHIELVIDDFIKEPHLISIENANTTLVLECVNEKSAKEIKKVLKHQYDVQILEDRFMAQIDLLDALSGGLW